MKDLLTLVTLELNIILEWAQMLLCTWVIRPDPIHIPTLFFIVKTKDRAEYIIWFDVAVKRKWLLGPINRSKNKLKKLKTQLTS